MSPRLVERASPRFRRGGTRPGGRGRHGGVAVFWWCPQCSPLFLWTRSRGMPQPAGPLSVVMGAKRPRLVLLSVRAAAARHHFQTLDFLAHGFVEDGVGQEDQPVGAGVGVVVLTGFPWTEYARLFGVHSL